jgi:hypothetical protein
MAVAAALAATGLLSGRARAATFHVDYEHGRDDRDGRSAATSWKHAPGDPDAQGEPARTTLRPGDVVSFAANVRYRGSILVKASGTAAAPIVFAGDGGDFSAIIDGSDPVAAIAPCPSAEACGGAAAWRRLVRIDLGKPVSANAALFADTGLMRPAQGPDPKDDFYRDEVDDMAEASGSELATGRARLPHAIAKGLAPMGGVLALWVKPNIIAYRPILGVDGDAARFDPTGLQFYTDRPEKVAVLNDVSLVDRPGEYAVLSDGRTVVALLPTDAKAVSVATGRGGFRIRGASHLVFRNLAFENMADDGKLAPFGVAIFADNAGSSDILIENNLFRRFSNPAGQGPLILRAVSHLRIAHNRIDTVNLGSGMRLSGPADDVVVEDNDIRRLGRTGIMLMGLTNVTVQRNVITDLLGVHGNGLSAYLDNHNVRFLANTVTKAKQPATFHGAGQQAGRDTNIVFANNLFIATPDALGSLISWGDWTRGVTIHNNVLLGGKMGLRMNAKDSGVILSDNIASGLAIAGDQPSDWRIVGNEWTQLTYQQRRAGDAASGRLASAQDQLMSQRVPKAVCDVIMRRSLGPAPPEEAASAAAVGAQLRCP